MTTLRDALEMTLRMRALEASFLQAIAGIQAIENAYVSPVENMSESRTTFTFAADNTPGEIKDTQSIFRNGMLYIRNTDEPYDWVETELDRPAIGPLSVLMLLYGADLDQGSTETSDAMTVRVDLDRARQNIPDEYRTTLEDLLSPSDIAQDGYFPQEFTVDISVSVDPLHIEEMTYTNPDIPATFALELHPTSRREITAPATNPPEHL